MKTYHIPVRSILACLFLAATQFSATAYATLIAPATVTGTLSAPVLDSSFGALDAAYNFGGADMTRDGIAFSGILSPGGNPITLTTTPFTLGMTGGSLGNASFGSDPLFETEIFASGSFPFSQTMTIDGLDLARTYLFQFIHGDTRTGGFNNWNETVSFTDSSGNVASTDLLFGNAGGALGTPFAVINVLASGTTSLQYDMPTNGPRGPSMSGLVISSVPAPATLALFGLGLAGLGWSRRKKT